MGNPTVTETDLFTWPADVPFTPNAFKKALAASDFDDLDVTLAAADGAIAVKEGTVVITKATAAALTIANPVATTDDGKILRILSITAAAHTISNAAGAGFNAGGAASDIATLTAAKGNNLVLQAYQGVWYVLSQVGATLA